MTTTDPEPRLLLSAKWTNDCQGKKDYDGPILEVSTRYWPRGGGFFVVRYTPSGVTVEPDATPTAIRSEVYRAAHRGLVQKLEDGRYRWVGTTKTTGE